MLLLFFELARSRDSDLTLAVVRTGDVEGNGEVGESSSAEELRLTFFVDLLRLSASPKADEFLFLIFISCISSSLI